MNEVKLLRLLSGETMLAKVLADDDKTVTLKDPLVIMVIPGKNANQHNIALVPWVEFSPDKTFELKSEHIVAIMTPDKKLESGYISQTSGIALPVNQGLILDS